MRCSHAQKHAAGFAGRTAALQVGCDGTPDIDWQWKALAPVALATHTELSASPVDIVQVQGGDLAGP